MGPLHQIQVELEKNRFAVVSMIYPPKDSEDNDRWHQRVQMALDHAKDIYPPNATVHLVREDSTRFQTSLLPSEAFLRQYPNWHAENNVTPSKYNDRRFRDFVIRRFSDA